jgi:hypothetical protein
MGGSYRGTMRAMTERKGFWSLRPREGRDDARILAAERVHSLRQLAYAELRSQSGDTQVEDVAGSSGQPFKRRTTIKRHSRGGQEDLRILVQVDNGSWRSRLNPLAEELILATPNGEMVGEYTMASEGNDPRRYGFPRRGS